MLLWKLVVSLMVFLLLWWWAGEERLHLCWLMVWLVIECRVPGRWVKLQSLRRQRLFRREKWQVMEFLSGAGVGSIGLVVDGISGVVINRLVPGRCVYRHDNCKNNLLRREWRHVFGLRLLGWVGVVGGEGS